MFILKLLLLPGLVTANIILQSRYSKTWTSSIFSGYDGSRANDGNYDSNAFNGFCSHTNFEMGYLTVGMPVNSTVSKVIIYNRSDCCGQRLSNCVVELVDESDIATFQCGTIKKGKPIIEISCQNKPGKYVRIRRLNIGYLTLCEVEIDAVPIDKFLLSRYKPTEQDSVFQNRVSSFAVDGNYKQTSDFCAHTAENKDSYWMVNLEDYYLIDFITVYTFLSVSGDMKTQLLDENNKVLHTCELWIDVKRLYRIKCHGKRGMKVKINQGSTINICEVDVFGTPLSKLLSKSRPTSQSSTYKIFDGDNYNSSFAVDGIYEQDMTTMKCSATHFEMAYWMVDLQDDYVIHYMKIYNRQDCCSERLVGAVVELLSSNNEIVFMCANLTESKSVYEFDCNQNEGRKVRIRNTREGILTLCEVEVYGFKRL